MPAGAVSGLSWILCALLFLPVYGARIRGRRPWGETPRVADTCRRLLVSYKPLAIARRGAREKRPVAEILHEIIGSGALTPLSLLRCRFWHRCGVSEATLLQEAQNHCILSWRARARPSSKRRWPPTAPQT